MARSEKDKEKDKKVTPKPKAFTIKYKRPRGSRACVVCRSRKVRCDAEIHIPCTNCITFGCDCVLPAVKKRGTGADPKRSTEDEDMVKSEPEDVSFDTGRDSSPKPKFQMNSSEPVLNISKVSIPPSLTSRYKNRPSVHKKELMLSKARASFTFLGLSSVGVIAQSVGDNHVQLNEDVFDINENSLDSVELEILKIRGAFLLPDKDLAMDLINSYFEHIHPLMPVINRTEFMAKFEDPNDNPPLMLLQAVLLCGCRISKNPLLLDANNSNNLACLTFFRRAKALYETNYESDPIAILQTLILISTYWEGPEDVTKNSFYWCRVAVGLAQGFGLHRDVSKSPLTANEKKIWRRVWWCIFEKDRNVAIAFGRPMVIDLSDCDVPMLTIEDFDENDPESGVVSPYPVNEKHALYFIHLVKLAEITGIILRHQYTVKAESMKKKNMLLIIQHCDMLMGIWFTNLPPQLTFSLQDESKQDFFCCILNAQYYNRLYLIHRSNLMRMARSNSTDPNNYKYPSWGISFQAARMISIISKILSDKGLIHYCHVMFVYIVYSALLMLIYHVDSTNKLISSTAADSLVILKDVLEQMSELYPIAKVLLKLFEKYASDQIKRAKVIEKSGNIALKQEISGAKHELENERNMSAYYGGSTPGSIIGGNGNNLSPLYTLGVLPASGVSPRSEIYNYKDPTKVSLEKMVQDVKKPVNDGRGSQNHDKSNTSPSSAASFPDISLVTEEMPTDLNFFQNFEPTQLFPNTVTNYSSRVQTPSVPVDNMPPEEYIPPPQTPGGTFSTNFIDNSFINMNLQLGADSYEDIGSYFNFQNSL